MHRLGVGALRRCSSAGAASGHRNGGGTVRWWKSAKVSASSLPMIRPRMPSLSTTACPRIFSRTTAT